MDAANEIEYKLRDLTTRSVTLFPTRAQVFREIKDVPLKAGENKISILGLTPTVDKDSVKVEGSGLAVITDISVTQEDNPEDFIEIYPEYDSPRIIGDCPSPSMEPQFEAQLAELGDIPELEEAKAGLEKLQYDLKTAEETIMSATQRLRLLDSFGTELSKRPEPVNISNFVGTYRAEREQMYRDQSEAERQKDALAPKITEAEVRVSLFTARQLQQHKVRVWEKERQEREKRKAEEKEDRRKKQEAAKKEAKRQRLLEFWPKYVYHVCITIEANPYTPMSSRRNSISSDLDLAKPTPSATEDGEGSTHCDLVLSYVTSSAFWAPSYDMQLSTTSASGTLLFDAQLHNSTSETWRNCHVTLSTSQATATSIDEPIPALVPWRIRLLNKGDHAENDAADISLSKEERKQLAQYHRQATVSAGDKKRENMFHGDPSTGHASQDYQMQLMLLEQQNKKRLARVGPSQLAQQQQQQQVMRQQMHQQMQMQMQAPPPPPPARAAPSGGGLFGSSASNAFGTVARSAGLFGRASGAQREEAESNDEEEDRDDVMQDFAFDSLLHGGNGDDDATLAAMPMPPPPAMEFKDSVIEETGLNTAYDLPGTKTLEPKSTSSKHRVARLSLANIAFSYTIVPKYKPVAYLKAKIRNGSKLTLLHGNMGLTLDGSFMGRTNLPRCSAGETLTLPLGIDPAIKVQYPGPDVRRATTGMFSKENSSLFKRSITLENTRSSKKAQPCQIFVHDQVPVSEDERLKVVIHAPKGLAPDGGAIKAGEPGASGPDGKDWGSADAITKSTGAVTWNVKLNPGKAVKLGLEYVVAMPSGGGHTAVSLK